MSSSVENNTSYSDSLTVSSASELVLSLTIEECFNRKNDWVRNELGEKPFTGGSLALQLLKACEMYRKKESEENSSHADMEQMKDKMLTAMAVWISWRTLHANGKLPESSILPMDAVDVIFSKVNEKIVQDYNINFQITG